MLLGTESASWLAGNEARTQRERWERVGRSWPDLYQARSTQYSRRCEVALVKRHAVMRRRR